MALLFASSSVISPDPCCWVAPVWELAWELDWALDWALAAWELD